MVRSEDKYILKIILFEVNEPNNNTKHCNFGLDECLITDQFQS